MYVIGLDIGTSGVKSTLFDDNANVISNAYSEYNLISDAPGHYEINPTELLNKSIAVIMKSTLKVKKEEVGAICFTSFGESFVCTDKNKNVLSNSMIYMDHRGEEECREFVERFTEDGVFEICMQPIESMFASYKLRWMQKHKPEVMAKTHKISFIADFVAYSLGADHVCDYSLCARSALFDVRKKLWWEEGVQFAGINSSILPKPVKSGSEAGKLSKEGAKLTGLREGTMLIIGGHDQVLAAVGSGISCEGDIANGMGTVDCITTLLSKSNIDTKIMKHYALPLIPYIDDDSYMTSAFNKSGGSIVKWFRDTMAKDLCDKPNAYAKLNSEMPLKPTSLIILPYFAGGATPEANSITPASLLGLTLNTSRGDIMRGIMEGEVFIMKRCYQCFDELKLKPGKFVIVGGGSKSDIWMQIKADVFNKVMDIPLNQEAGTLASALLCYVKLGIVSSLKEAQEKYVLTQKSFAPIKSNVEFYNKQYHKFLQANKKVTEIYNILEGK